MVHLYWLTTSAFFTYAAIIHPLSSLPILYFCATALSLCNYRLSNNYKFKSIGAIYSLTFILQYFINIPSPITNCLFLSGLSLTLITYVTSKKTIEKKQTTQTSWTAKINKYISFKNYTYGPTAIIESFKHIKRAYSSLWSEHTPTKTRNNVITRMALYLTLQFMISIIDLITCSYLIGPLMSSLQSKNLSNFFNLASYLFGAQSLKFLIMLNNAFLKRDIQSEWLHDSRQSIIKNILNKDNKAYLEVKNITLNNSTIRTGQVLENYANQYYDFTIVASSKILIFITETLGYSILLFNYSPYAFIALIPYTLWSSLVFLTISPCREFTQEDSRLNSDFRKNNNETLDASMDLDASNAHEKSTETLLSLATNIRDNYFDKNLWKRACSAIEGSINQTLQATTFFICGYLYSCRLIPDVKTFFTIQSTLVLVVRGINKFMCNAKMYVTYNFKADFFEKLLAKVDMNTNQRTHITNAKQSPLKSKDTTHSPRTDQYSFYIENARLVSNDHSDENKVSFKLNIPKTLSFKYGEKILITGPSGSGKTNFFKLLLGQEKENSKGDRNNRLYLEKINNDDRFSKHVGEVMGIVAPNNPKIDNTKDNQPTKLIDFILQHEPTDQKHTTKDCTDRIINWCKLLDLDPNISTTALSTGQIARCKIINILHQAHKEAYKCAQDKNNYKPIIDIFVFDETGSNLPDGARMIYRNELAGILKAIPENKRPTFIETSHRADDQKNTYFDTVCEFTKKGGVSTISKRPLTCGTNEQKESTSHLNAANF